MSQNNKYITLLLSVSVFVIFFSYYFISSNILPKGAGPDWKSNTDVAQFIYENGRLAVLPEDEKALHFTVYGGTRALRPPLSYIVSAIAARAFSFTGLDLFVLFRKGSALLCALAVALTFYGLSLYFSSYRIGLLSASIIGLMPQYTFIASYTNDDSGAIFSATLMLVVLIRIYRYGVNNTNAALFGLALGLVILSKMSAWLLLPFVILFLIIYIREPVRLLLRYSAIAGVVFMFSGGWWLALNMYNYGIDAPLLTTVYKTSAQQHRRLPPDQGVGYAAQGIGFYQLLVKNQGNFLGETAKSAIGNMDWLQLRVGPLQYGVYLLIFYSGLLYYFFSLTGYLFRRIMKKQVNEDQAKKLIFESLLVGIIIFQIIMYTWTNIYNDIQIQGKYLIPVFLAVLTLFFSATLQLSSATAHLGSRASAAGYSLNAGTTRNIFTFMSAMILIIFIHWQAWVDYVIPFYNPPAYDVRVGEFREEPLELTLKQSAVNMQINKNVHGLKLISTGGDPKVILGQKICSSIKGNALLRLELRARNAGVLQIFIDEGIGYTEKYSYTARYREGDNILLVPVTSGHCQNVRLDPFVDDGTIILKSLQIAPMVIRPSRKYN